MALPQLGLMSPEFATGLGRVGVHRLGLDPLLVADARLVARAVLGCEDPARRRTAHRGAGPRTGRCRSPRPSKRSCTRSRPRRPRSSSARTATSRASSRASPRSSPRSRHTCPSRCSRCSGAGPVRTRRRGVAARRRRTPTSGAALPSTRRRTGPAATVAVSRRGSTPTVGSFPSAGGCGPGRS